MLEDIGDLSLEDMDESNIPVNCFLTEPDEDGGKWTWEAENFMPRRRLIGGSYDLEADSKDEILEAVRKHVVPLYEAALKNLRETGENYYWKEVDL